MARINITYSLEDFMKYKERNMFLPPNLKPMCNDVGGTLILRDAILREVSSVMDSFNLGKNPNDIVFKNMIIEYLNKINQKNYPTILDSLRSLSYSKKEHFITLTSDLLLRAMTDNTAVRGLDLPTGQKSLSELYADIVSEFSTLLIKENDSNVKFISVFLESCQKYFVDFVDKNKPLDQNNQYRVDNFKGFMNFLGVLYSRNLISNKVILDCVNKVVELIFVPSWGSIETENAYDGYRRIMTQLLNYYSNKKLTADDRKYIEMILNTCSNVEKRNDSVNKLRKFTMMYHRDLILKFQRLLV